MTLERLGVDLVGRGLVCPVIKLGYDPAMVESRLPTSRPFPVPLRTNNPLEFRSELSRTFCPFAETEGD